MPCCIVFILDNSGSMSTRAHQNFSFFDMAKTYIETFIKGRSKNDNRQMAMGRDGDRYYLMTTSAPYPQNVKVAGDKNPFPILEELKKITMPAGSLPIHLAILDSFRLMHINRTLTGIDAYGSGRAPQNSEQVLIILLTDGSGVASIPADFKLNIDPCYLGSEMTRDAYRWDQKFFSVVFRIPSTPYRPTSSQLLAIDIDIPNIEKLCTATGGRSFSIVSTRQVNTSIDQMLSVVLAHRIGVRFDCITIPGKPISDESAKLRARFKKILERKPVTNLISRVTPQGRPVTCHWTIPENYYPVKNMETLPARLSHPMILLAPEAIPLSIRNDLPFDKLEVEIGGVTEIVMEMLQGRKDFGIPVFISNSGNPVNVNYPFGCLRLNTLGAGVNLILMPFNYPVLYQLVEEIKDPQSIANPQWRSRLDQYVQTVPFYCYTTLRQAMDKFKVRLEISSSMSNTYAPGLLSNLNRLKNKGKDEHDNIVLGSKMAETKSSRMHNPSIRIERITSRSSVVGVGRIDDGDEEEETSVEELKPIYSGDFKIPLYPPTVNDPELDTIYRSPWSSSIDNTVMKLNKMQANIELLFNPDKISILDMAKIGVKARFNNLEELHNLPLKTMGEYEPYQNARNKHYGQPFKKIEEEKERTHAFGNPYKMKSFGAGIDEVMDSAIIDNTKRDGKRDGEFRMGGGPPKRRKGPLGIDAFDKWRTRRSMGSRASSVLSDISDFDDPSTSNTLFEMQGFAEEPMDDENGLMARYLEVEKMMEKKNSEKEALAAATDGANGSRPVPLPVNKLTKEEIVTKKMEIGAIVRRPANHRAFDEIIKLTNGITKDGAEQLVKHAIREAQRFKHKILTEKLEKQLALF